MFMHPAFSPAICSEEELFKLADRNKNTYFSNYYGERDIKRQQFISAISHLKIDLNNKVVLDLGPGTGDSLEVAKEMGAARCMAVDSDPYFVKLQLLRGHQAYLKDYTRKAISGGYFPPEAHGADFIWCKGALNCVDVNKGRSIGTRMAKDIIKRFNFASWVREMKSLLNAEGSILFLPAVERKDKQIVDPDYPIKTYYWIEDEEAWDRSYFATILESEGFKQIKDIPHFNQPLAFPTAYIYVD